MQDDEDALDLPIVDAYEQTTPDKTVPEPDPLQSQCNTHTSKAQEDYQDPWVAEGICDVLPIVLSTFRFKWFIDFQDW